MSDFRERAKQAAAKRAKLQPAKDAVQRAPPPVIVEPVKVKVPAKPRPVWQTLMYVAAIVLVILAGCGVILKLQMDRAWDTAFGGLSVEQVIASTSLSVYCESIEAPQDCDAWADQVVRERSDAALYCDGNYDWIEDKQGFTLCLLVWGVSMVSGSAIIERVKTSDWKDGDYRVIAQLSRYCDGSQNENYCTGWSVLTYRDHRIDIWNCDQQHRNDQVGFTNCVIGLGVKA